MNILENILKKALMFNWDWLCCCSVFHYLKIQGEVVMVDKRLYLRTPQIDDLDYRRQLLADEDTMSYNIGFARVSKDLVVLTKSDYENFRKY